MTSNEPLSNGPGEGDYPVTIARYPSAAVARIDASILLGAGIDADVQGEYGSDALSYYGTAVQQITLVVPSKQRDQAIQILTEAARSRPAQRTEDWICGQCEEINGPEFDSCWSCGKPWNASDLGFEPEPPHHVLPEDVETPLELPPLDANPYAPPNAVRIAMDAGSEEVDLVVRRMTRGIILSFAFPPLLVVCAMMGISLLVRGSNGSVSMTVTQRRKLLWRTLLSGVAGAIVVYLLIGSGRELLRLSF